jgi:hypothetical protein
LGCEPPNTLTLIPILCYVRDPSLRSHRPEAVSLQEDDTR